VSVPLAAAVALLAAISTAALATAAETSPPAEPGDGDGGRPGAGERIDRFLRGAIEDHERGARYAAVLAIVAALNIPLVHFSVYWWRTLHQPPSLLKPGSSTMPPVILAALLVNFAALALLGAYFVARRARVLAVEEEALA